MSKKNNPHVYKAVQVLIDIGEGWYLEHRDDKDGIFWPDRYGLWGGSFEDEDSGVPLRAALRELYEESKLTADDLELVKMDVVSYDKKQFIDEALAPTEVHYFYARLKTNRAIHAYEGDGAKLFLYDTMFENNHNFTPYVADAVHMTKRFK